MGYTNINHEAFYLETMSLWSSALFQPQIRICRPQDRALDTWVFENDKYLANCGVVTGGCFRAGGRGRL